MTDVVIIGGGIAGAACAYYLTLAGLQVKVLDRNFPVSGTSRACDGLILHFDKLSPAELSLALASSQMWSELAQTLPADFEYCQQGVLVLSETPQGWTNDRQKAAELAQAGVRSQVLDGAELRRLEPNLAPDLCGGVYYMDEAQVDSRLAALALLDGAIRQGAEVESAVPVTGILLDAARRVRGVRTATGDVSTGAVVCAAGVWSGELMQTLGIALPVQPRKGHILVTGRVPGLIRHPLLEGSYAAAVQSAAQTTQAALVAEMTAGDTVLLGSSREFAGFDLSVSVPVMQAIAARALRFIPGLARSCIVRSYAGLRPWSPDHLPLIGPVGAVPGLYLATGHEGAGIGLAPITGQIVADWISSGRTPEMAESVHPDRFSSLIAER